MRRKAANRELIEPHKADKRYIRRDARGRIKDSDDVSRSLVQDRRRKAKTPSRWLQSDYRTLSATSLRIWRTNTCRCNAASRITSAAASPERPARPGPRPARDQWPAEVGLDEAVQR
jgi:hypothetical protein